MSDSSRRNRRNRRKTQKGKGLVPVLRFPAFRGEWHSKELGKCFTNIGGTALEKYVTEDGTHHFISIGNYSTDGKYIDKGQRIEANDVTKPKLLNKNDLVMVLNDKTLAGDIIGSTLLINENNKYIYNQRSERLIIDSDLMPMFAWQLLNSQIVRKGIFKRSQGGTQIYVNFPIVKKLQLTIPEKEEQQKIADCLSSLDELITLQTQKRDALKTHKKGLMQQLFPATGETQPKLRFPEFRGEGVWDVYKIGDFINSYKGGASLTPKDFLTYSNYEVIPKKAIGAGAWLNLEIENGTYCTEDFYNNNPQSIVDSTYLITTLRDLVPSGPSIGYIVKYTGKKKYILAQGVYGLKPKEMFISDFLVHYSNTVQYRKLVNAVMVGTTQVHIRNGDFLKLPINVPSIDEQQKIADCLSSLDALITAQSQKIDALKSHKKGLMQQLFPSMDDDCMEAVRPGAGREAGLGHAGGSAAQDAKAEAGA